MSVPLTLHNDTKSNYGGDDFYKLQSYSYVHVQYPLACDPIEQGRAGNRS